VAHLNSELSEKISYIESLNEENKKYLDVIVKYSLGGAKAANGTIVVNGRRLK
jgi:hypothetical protein